MIYRPYVRSPNVLRSGGQLQHRTFTILRDDGNVRPEHPGLPLPEPRPALLGRPLALAVPAGLVELFAETGAHLLDAPERPLRVLALPSRAEFFAVG